MIIADATSASYAAAVVAVTISVIIVVAVAIVLHHLISYFPIMLISSYCVYSPFAFYDWLLAARPVSPTGNRYMLRAPEPLTHQLTKTLTDFHKKSFEKLMNLELVFLLMQQKIQS